MNKVLLKISCVFFSSVVSAKELYHLGTREGKNKDAGIELLMFK